SVQRHHDLLEAAGIVTPGFQSIRSVFDWDDGTQGLADWKSMLFQHSNYFLEVFGQGISRAQNVQLLLDKQTCLVGHRLLGIADVDDPAAERDFFHRRAEGLR